MKDLKSWLTFVRRKVLAFGLRGLLFCNKVLTRLGFRRVYYAEFFTDRYIRNTFFPDFDYRGVVVEVGCATPMLLSMSQHFRQNGWRCLGVEPNPKFADLHREKGFEVYEYAATDFDRDDVDFTVMEETEVYTQEGLSAHSYSALKIKDEYADYAKNTSPWSLDNLKQYQIKVKARRLDTILAQHCPEIQAIDLLTVDVEGFEMDVVRGVDLRRYKIKVVVLECLFDADQYLELMHSQGYRLHSRISYNYIFVPV